MFLIDDRSLMQSNVRCNIGIESLARCFGQKRPCPAQCSWRVVRVDPRKAAESTDAIEPAMSRTTVVLVEQLQTLEPNYLYKNIPANIYTYIIYM